MNTQSEIEEQLRIVEEAIKREYNQPLRGESNTRLAMFDAYRCALQFALHEGRPKIWTREDTARVYGKET